MGPSTWLNTAHLEPATQTTDAPPTYQHSTPALPAIHPRRPSKGAVFPSPHNRPSSRSFSLLTMLQYDANKPLPNDISLQKPVSPPLANDGTNFTMNTPITVPTPTSSQVTTSAKPGSTALAAGFVNGNPHLYVVDTPNHRIMDLEFLPGQSVNVPQTTSTSTITLPEASPTPSTGVGAVSQPSLKLIQQFASPTILSAVKSTTVSSDGRQLYLLTQNGGTLTTISPIDRVPSC